MYGLNVIQAAQLDLKTNRLVNDSIDIKIRKTDLK